MLSIDIDTMFDASFELRSIEDDLTEKIEYNEEEKKKFNSCLIDIKDEVDNLKNLINAAKKRLFEKWVKEQGNDM